MRFLFDQNLSSRLVDQLSDLFPSSNHVSRAGLDRATDRDVWTYARANSYIIVTKDADFGDLCVVQGFPPKVIWLRLGNCTTYQIEHTLRANHQAIVALNTDPTLGILDLF